MFSIDVLSNMVAMGKQECMCMHACGWVYSFGLEYAVLECTVVLWDSPRLFDTLEVLDYVWASFCIACMGFLSVVEGEWGWLVHDYTVGVIVNVKKKKSLQEFLGV